MLGRFAWFISVLPLRCEKARLRIHDNNESPKNYAGRIVPLPAFRLWFICPPAHLMRTLSHRNQEFAVNVTFSMRAVSLAAEEARDAARAWALAGAKRAAVAAID